jgi:hypothetical protein
VTVTFERPLLCGDRLVELRRQVTLGGPTGEQVSAQRERLALGEPQRPFVLCCRLAMRTRTSSALGGGRRPPQDAVDVAGRLGVMGKRREIRAVAAAGREGGERPAMQRQPVSGRDRLLDREARQLMPEVDVRMAGDEHARGQALVNTLDEIAGKRLQQPQRHVPGDDRDSLEQSARRRGQAGGARENRVAHRLGDTLAAGREDLGDEERVAGRRPVQLFRVDSVRLCQFCDRRRRERLDLQPTGPAHELAQHEPQLLGTIELVIAITGQDQGRDRADPSRQHRDHVERRLVGPMHVLEHDHRRHPASELPQQRRRHLVRLRRARDELLELAADRLGDV